MKHRSTFVFALLFLGLAAVAWHFVKDRNPRSESAETRELPTDSRKEVGNSGPTRSVAQKLEDSAANAATSGTKEVSDESVEMRNLAAVPVSVGKKGLWAGAAPSDAAIPGKTAYGLARLGDSKADLRPDQNGMFQRLHAPVDSSIEFQIRYTDLKKDDVVHVGLLDGGKLEDAGPFKPDPMGRIAFKFQTGPSDGSYRISLTCYGPI